MHLRNPFLIFALTLQSCSFPLDFQRRGEYPVVRTRASYSVVDVDGNEASTPTYLTSPVIETMTPTFRSKYTSTTLTTNQPAGSRSTAQEFTGIPSALSMTMLRDKTTRLDSVSAKASMAPISTKIALPANPSYFIVNPEGTTAPLSIAIPTTTTTTKNDLRPSNIASVLLPNFTNALVRIHSGAILTATAKYPSTSLHTPASELPSNTSSKPLQPSSTVNSVYEPTRNPSTRYDGVGSTPYHLRNINSTTPARWNLEARVASPS